MVSWNCCGLGNPATVRRIKELHKSIAPHIMFLMETKNSDNYVLQELQDLSYPHHTLISPHGVGGGGLALFWSQEVAISILSSSHNFIDTIVSFKGINVNATFVYGEPDISKRATVWNNISDMASERNGPWILTGDFNDILENSEKSGGPLRAESSFFNFRNFLARNDLFDLRHTGNCLSWRGQRHTHLIHSRLDRTLVNSAWFDAFPQGQSIGQSIVPSDHRPVHSAFSASMTKSGRIFRYDRRLKDVPEVKDLIKAAWEGSPSASVSHKLTQCRRAIVSWCRSHHTNSRKAIEDLKSKVDTAMADPTVEEATVSTLNTALLEAYKAEEQFWRQRSRLLWLTLGDRNTSFFHAVSKGRRARNKLSVMESSEGNTLYEEDQIASEIARYFSNIFTSAGFDGTTTVAQALNPCISEAMNASLTSLPTAGEIKRALFSIHPDKAPGPDGFSACFFQSNWQAVCPAIVSEVRSFFATGIMPTGINATHVRLIPKTHTAKTVAEFRPIALCNVYYKVISKILSLRLRPILGDIISESQSAFLPGRAISDNVLITHEVLHYLKTSEAQINCFMAVKTDMSKAYDRLEWSFIKAVFERLGFSAIWVNWIMQCISTVSYSFLINDTAREMVVPDRGIRQGDPLSPYIFILCGEVLSGLCCRAQNSGDLTGIRVARHCPRLTHLLFADDTMFFIKATTSNASTLHAILQQYELASGQLINLDKSSISFSAKTPQETRISVKQTLGIAKEGGVGKYLGLPELFTRKKRDLFSSIVERIKIKAASWSSRRLSPAGKLTMLKSVLTATPTYSMLCFLLPVGLCNSIQSALTRFWWDADPSTRKICWVSWDTLSTSKDSGGLGFRDIQAFNIAMLGKVAWRLVTKPDCLLARTLLGKYCYKGSFLTVPCPSSSSHGWRGIIAGRDLLIRHLGKVIGNGNSTKVWSNSWLSSSEDMRILGPPREIDRDLVVADLMIRGSNEWNHTKIEATCPQVAHLIYLIRPSAHNMEDIFC